MKRVLVTIQSKGPLELNRFRGFEANYKAPKSEKAIFEDKVWRLPSGNLAIPAGYIKTALISVCRLRDGSKSASVNDVDRGVAVRPELIDLGRKTYERKEHIGVVVGTGATIVTRMAHIPSWKASFTIHYDASLLTERKLMMLLADVRFYGIRQRSPYGRGSFSIKSWEETKLSKKA